MSRDLYVSAGELPPQLRPTSAAPCSQEGPRDGSFDLNDIQDIFSALWHAE
jgi:hypothetical protein